MKFNLPWLIFRRAVSVAQKSGHDKNVHIQPKCASDRGTTGNISFCSLLLK